MANRLRSRGCTWLRWSDCGLASDHRLAFYDPWSAALTNHHPGAPCGCLGPCVAGSGCLPGDPALSRAPTLSGARYRVLPVFILVCLRHEFLACGLSARSPSSPQIPRALAGDTIRAAVLCWGVECETAEERQGETDGAGYDSVSFPILLSLFYGLAAICRRLSSSRSLFCSVCRS